MDKGTCVADQCEKPAVVKSMCKMHYNRDYYTRQRSGDVAVIEPGTGSCRRCGAAVERRAATGPMPRYCSRRCQRQTHYETSRPAKAEQERLTRAAARSVPKSCKHCGQTFTPQKSAAQIFCSRSCGSSFHRDSSQRSCSIEDCNRPVRAKDMCRVHYNKLSPNRSAWSQGKPETRRANLRRKTQQRRARMMGDGNAPLIDRNAVGARDGWICGLCSRVVDHKIPWPAMQSPSLDHILPLSKGGKHELSNVQITHLGCNMRKGARSEYEQQLLIG